MILMDSNSWDSTAVAIELFVLNLCLEGEVYEILLSTGIIEP